MGLLAVYVFPKEWSRKSQTSKVELCSYLTLGRAYR